MAALDDSERAGLWAGLMRDLSDSREAVGITKGALRAALDSADDWAEANAAAFNAALPQPARSALSARQKARLLAVVLRRRWEVG